MEKASQVDLGRVEIDGRSGRVIFHGECLEMHPVCQAWCCRNEWIIELTAEEYASGCYAADEICALSNKICHMPDQPCGSRRYQLSKREDKSCTHLQGNHCSIYEVRPKVCRDFLCQGGWRLNAPAPVLKADEEAKKSVLTAEKFVAGVREEVIFVPHPLMKLHTIFYLPAKREIIFVKEMLGACGKFNTRDELDLPSIDDQQLMALAEFFNRKESLGKIYRRFCSHYPGSLSPQQFHQVVWLFNKHSIVLDSRHFSGMLSGMGGIG